MGVFSGKHGSLTFDGNAIARVRDWSFSGQAETFDITNLGDNARRYDSHLKAGSGSCTIFYNDDTDGNIVKILNSTIRGPGAGGPQAGKFKLQWKRSGRNNFLEFNAFITSVDLGVSAGEVMTASLQFQMSEDYIDTSL